MSRCRVSFILFPLSLPGLMKKEAALKERNKLRMREYRTQLSEKKMQSSFMTVTENGKKNQIKSILVIQFPAAKMFSISQKGFASYLVAIIKCIVIYYLMS